MGGNSWQAAPSTMEQTLRIRANPAEGYRTYSRQTVTGPGEWRVQVSSAEGRTLHEQRFAVQ